jgi:hypothetical protein
MENKKAISNVIRSLLLIIAIICFSLNARAASVIRDGSLEGRSDGNNITVQWATDDESGVKEFSIERRAGTSGDFIEIGTLTPKGNGSFYEFIDQSAFKAGSTPDIAADLYQYRLRIINTDNTFSYSSVISVSHTVSSVKRTWGSLKAMFR